MMPLWRRILDGLISLCMMLLFDRIANAFSKSLKQWSAFLYSIFPSLRISCSSVPPLQYSQTKQQLLAVLRIQMNRTTWVVSSILERVWIQLMVNYSSLGLDLNFYMRIILMATVCNVFSFTARQTLPNQPSPTMFYRTQFSIFLPIAVKCLIISRHIYMLLINKLRRPLLPVLMITTSLDQQRVGNLIAKFQKLNYARCKAIGLVIEIDNYMPVQIEKIRNLLMHIQFSHKLPLYGFCQSKVSAQSFYLLSICDHLYASPSSIFEFHSHETVLDTTGLLSSLGVERFMVKSNSELSEIGCSLQGNTAQVNLIRKEIKESLISQSVKTISERKKGGLICQTGESPQERRLLSLVQSQTHLLGHQAAELGLVQGIEQYYEALHRLYPTCQIRHVRLKDKMSTRLVQFFVASPIVLIIVLIKMLVKYSILMYIYLKHSEKK